MHIYKSLIGKGVQEFRIVASSYDHQNGLNFNWIKEKKYSYYNALFVPYGTHYKLVLDKKLLGYMQKNKETILE